MKRKRQKKIISMRSILLLCFCFGIALGGGLYESLILNPLWSKNPPSSFSIIQPKTGVPLQWFWVPVHMLITLFIILSLAFSWPIKTVRRQLLFSLYSYIIMRGWSGLYFIPEMLRFQKISVYSVPTPELTSRVKRWTFQTWFRAPLDIASFLFSLLAFCEVKKN